MNKTKITNWSNYPIVKRLIFVPESKQELITNIVNNTICIARGNGRSYGDCSYSQQIIKTEKLNKIIFFDEIEGVVRCESGVLLEDILQLIVPKGFFLPVTPGTKFITIGGAVASDIHGKNHHIDGNFSNFIKEIELINEHAEVLNLSQGDELFLKTIGGLGLTGIITEVEFSLKKIETSFIKSKNITANNLKEIIDLMIHHKSATYSVAWIDCLAKGENLGRSVLMLGEHAQRNDIPLSMDNLIFKLHKNIKFKLPFFFPSWFLSPLTIKIFNNLYFSINARKKEQIIHYDPYFYPLDAVAGWNKIYGKNGFVEYQFVIPLKSAYQGITEILQIISEQKLASFLCVIKLFGDNSPKRYLNFPQEGITLGMDLKMSKNIWEILEKLDTIVNKYDGRIYLTKDSRLNSENFKIQYPEKLETNSKFQSDQSIRLNQKNMNNYLIIGANSDIAKSYVNYVAIKEPDARFILCSQNMEELNSFVRKFNLVERAELISLNLLEQEKFVQVLENMKLKPSTILYAAGICPDNDEVFSNQELIEKMIQVNYTSAVQLLNLFVTDYNPFLKKIIGISSIAGIRGRKSNFMYGSSKAAFHQYLFGLRQRLNDDGILVQSVTPGAVRTKMTAHLKLPFFASTPDQIAKKVYRTKNRFQIYPNLLWRIIAVIVKISPKKVVAKLK
jgi:decaprenylphospho-beta-D-ribofuranose 2-oxidase